PRERIGAFFSRNPALWAFAAALIAPAALTPDWAVDASQAVVFGILPLGFFVVGVTLAAEAKEGVIAFPPPFTRPVGVALGLRLLLAPAIMFVLSTGVHEVPESYLSQAGMASAINGLVVAHEYGLERALVASVIAWSSAIVVAGGLVLALV
ncbi:MAG: AEC family transporter, partial [Actinomycetota bacterium]|nr:AEC family transporter [Actinomycetota bacterium]